MDAVRHTKKFILRQDSIYNLFIILQMEDHGLSRQRIFKVILVGGQAVGKSSLINRFVDGNFKEEYFTTIGIDFKMHNVTVG